MKYSGNCHDAYSTGDFPAAHRSIANQGSARICPLVSLLDWWGYSARGAARSGYCVCHSECVLRRHLASRMRAYVCSAAKAMPCVVNRALPFLGVYPIRATLFAKRSLLDRVGRRCRTRVVSSANHRMGWGIRLYALSNAERIFRDHGILQPVRGGV